MKVLEKRRFCPYCKKSLSNIYNDNCKKEVEDYQKTFPFFTEEQKTLIKEIKEHLASGCTVSDSYYSAMSISHRKAICFWSAQLFYNARAEREDMLF